MRIGIVLFLVAAAIMANIYTEGRFIKSFMKYKKYYKNDRLKIYARTGIEFIPFSLRKGQWEKNRNSKDIGQGVSRGATAH